MSRLILVFKRNVGVAYADKINNEKSRLLRLDFLTHLWRHRSDINV